VGQPRLFFHQRDVPQSAAGIREIFVDDESYSCQQGRNLHRTDLIYPKSQSTKVYCTGKCVGLTVDEIVYAARLVYRLSWSDYGILSRLLATLAQWIARSLNFLQC
jgi:hypothetical protein